MSTSPHASGYALLIGVERYQGLPDGKQLFAGRNDALAFYKVCRRFGVESANITLLTSPRLGLEDLLEAERSFGLSLGEASEEAAKAVTLGEATAARIEEALAELGRRRDREGDAPANRLLTYSGHGASKGGELWLCPSDVGDDLERGISLAALSGSLEAVAEDLTVVLDCCFAASSDLPEAHLGTNLRADAEGEIDLSSLGGRVLCASAAEQPSIQTRLDGRWRGAFGWSLTVALDQWKLVREGDSTRSSVTYGELIERSGALLSALSFAQTPSLLHAKEIASLPAFHHGLDVGAGEASEEPDVERRGGQLDPSGTEVLFTLMAGSTHIADILVTGSNPPQYLLPNTEHYSFKNPIPENATTLRITAKDMTGLPAGKDWGYTWDVNAEMGQSLSTSAESALFLYSPEDLSHFFGIYWTMAKSGDLWLGWISFLNGSNSKLFKGLSPDKIDFTLHNNKKPPSGAWAASTYWEEGDGGAAVQHNRKG